MSVYSGPQVSTNGLVFYYDMNNTDQSWKGKPTTNKFTNPNNLSSGWTYNAATYSGTDKLVETATTSVHYVLQNTSVTSGLAYTQSVKATASERRYIQIFPSTGFANTSWTNYDLIGGTYSTTGSDTAGMTYLGNNEWLCYHTSTATSSTSSGRFAIATVLSTSAVRAESFLGTTNYGVFLRDNQFEQSSFPTPFVTGTRTNTQAILDLMNTYTVTATALTYSSNNTFSFDGEDDTATISNGIIYSGGFTFSAWVNPTNAGENTFGRILDKTTTTDSGSGVFLYMNNNPVVTIQIDNGTQITSTVDSVPYGNWTNVTVTVTSGGAVVIYINGESNATGTTSAPSLITTSNLLTIGNRSGATDRSFNGSISAVSIYEAVLAAQEVRQNYLATKSRYGL